jgi:hypothetical protein
MGDLAKLSKILFSFYSLSFIVYAINYSLFINYSFGNQYSLNQVRSLDKVWEVNKIWHKTLKI